MPPRSALTVSTESSSTKTNQGRSFWECGKPASCPAVLSDSIFSAQGQFSVVCLVTLFAAGKAQSPLGLRALKRPAGAHFLMFSSFLLLHLDPNLFLTNTAD